VSFIFTGGCVILVGDFFLGELFNVYHLEMSLFDFNSLKTIPTDLYGLWEPRENLESIIDAYIGTSAGNLAQCRNKNNSGHIKLGCGRYRYRYRCSYQDLKMSPLSTREGQHDFDPLIYGTTSKKITFCSTETYSKPIRINCKCIKERNVH
jgi:hypothetical protein